MLSSINKRGKQCNTVSTNKVNCMTRHQSTRPTVRHSIKVQGKQCDKATKKEAPAVT
ncbi:hypothetical protein DPMN_001826 [Dreissena polymorpha]|uniref:Uncharacterized protein n=1 Tax=Dreissena polymorpha TaxID=45954 RepID=A0A9D4MM09_DREPO|nr:hypothetical protein DPMN_001826 [Dreissena polymorpha]